DCAGPQPALPAPAPDGKVEVEVEARSPAPPERAGRTLAPRRPSRAATGATAESPRQGRAPVPPRSTAIIQHSAAATVRARQLDLAGPTPAWESGGQASARSGPVEKRPSEALA